MRVEDTNILYAWYHGVKVYTIVYTHKGWVRSYPTLTVTSQKEAHNRITSQVDFLQSFYIRIAFFGIMEAKLQSDILRNIYFQRANQEAECVSRDTID